MEARNDKRLQHPLRSRQRSWYRIVLFSRPGQFFVVAATFLVILIAHQLYAIDNVNYQYSTQWLCDTAATMATLHDNKTTASASTRRDDTIGQGGTIAVDANNQRLSIDTAINFFVPSTNISDPATYLPAYLQKLPSESRPPVKYSWSDVKPTRPLSFLHIPKSGGSSIEQVAANTMNMSWGVCMFRKNPVAGTVECPKDVNYTVVPLQPSLQEKYTYMTSLWHTPLQYLPVNFKGSVNQKAEIDNPYQGKDIFAVIRNPYTRMVSREYWKWQYEYVNMLFCDLILTCMVHVAWLQNITMLVLW